MSVGKQSYIITGYRFGEEFTNEYFEQDFRDEMEWEEDKPINEPFFITDGMNGGYTFFGFITLLGEGGWEEDIKELNLEPPNEGRIEEVFKRFFPQETIPEIKTYYLPHYH